MSIGGTASNPSQTSAKKSQKTIDQTNPKLMDVGDAAFDFTKDYFDKYITPAIGKLTDATQTTIDRNTEIYNTQTQQAADFKKLFDEQGQPAIKQYMDTVKDFSTDEYADRQAQMGIGDVRNQQANEEAATGRALGARGINASSPAAAAIKQQSGVTYAVAAAAQAARARDLATNQKLNLQSDAAAKGLSMAGLAPSVTQAQVSTVGQGGAIPASNLNAVAGAQQAQYPGYGAATDAYGTVLNAASGVQKQAQQDATKAQQAEDSGMGSAIGSAVGLGLAMFSDRRLKTDIEVSHTTPDGLTVYRFRYKWSMRPEMGYMADEVIMLYPDAVSETPEGWQIVDYTKTKYTPWQTDYMENV